jgi:threonine/homoserine/homoserine lactone efflux protein
MSLSDTSFGLFLQALWIGLSIAAPVGPIGLLTIQRTLDQGPRIGLATGMGAAVADACYGALGAFGSTLVIGALTGARPLLALLGGAVLLHMAWQLWRSQPAERATPLASGPDLWRSFASTFVLTLSNPATIFSFIAIFGALAAGAARAVSPWPMIAGVFCGSALWWLLLCSLVGRWRHGFDTRWRRRINRLSALMLSGFALWQGAQLLR